MMDILLFVILFGVVVFVHELGHFLVAKKSGVKVERFALGFGPAILKKKVGETEYAICAFPLGGYVKMTGEEPEEGAENDPRSFAAKSPWTRLAIAGMGPTSNLILPVFLFTAIFLAGLPTLTSKVGSVIQGSPADLAGIRPGDEILAVNGRNLWKWNDLVDAVKDQAGKDVKLRVLRAEKEFETTVTPSSGLEKDMFEEEKSVGKIGVSPQGFRASVGLDDPNGAGAKAGLRTGDVITAVNGRPVTYWWQLEEAWKAAQGPKKIAFDRYSGPPEKPVTESKTAELPAAAATLSKAGLGNGELFVREVLEKSVAAERGIKAGDKIVSANGKPLADWHEFQVQIRENSGQKLVLGLLRERKPLSLDVAPREITEKDEITHEKKTRRQLGVVSAAVANEPGMRDEQYRNPFLAFGHGLTKTYEQSVLTVKGLWKVVTGKIELQKSLGGPITIFYLAGTSYKLGGWVYFLQMMAMLSLTLGLINLLPIPVLDGGHIFFCVIEIIKGGPVSGRVREIAQQVGLAVLIGLILLTFYVDINRYFVDRIKSFFN